jgi:hypothetical protein
MSDPSTDKSAVLLEGILQTLKQINDNLSLQERRWDSLAEVLGNSSTLPSRSGELRTAWPPLSSLTITPKDENMFDHRKPVGTQKLPSSETPYHNLGVPHFPPFKAGKEADSMTDYRSWRSPLENSPLHQHSFLTEQLGDAWTIPDDGRLPLSFSREVLESLGPDQLRLAVSYIGKFRDRMARSKEQRFHVIDYDGVGGNIAYRLGQPIVRGAQELKPISNTKTTVDAPWRRFV